MIPSGQRAVRPRERMNSPLENRKVRLRGLGGPGVCGVSRTCASAPGDHRIRSAMGTILRVHGLRPLNPNPPMRNLLRPLLLLGSLAAAAPLAAQDSTVVILVRHAEKAVVEAGNNDPPL